MDFDILKNLVKPSDTKILLLVMDGLGGLPTDAQDFTELEYAKTPNLDKLAKEGICGLHDPVAPGITPGSGPAHLSIFGYDPLRYQVGRGVLSALGINFDLKDGDVASRGNFCTVDSEGKVTDRRAGRIPTEKCAELCDKLKDIKLSDAEFFIQPVKEYRFLTVFRGEGLFGELADTDPQKTGRLPLPPRALKPDAEKTAKVVAEFIEKAKEKLKGESPANMVLMRGFSRRPDWPLFPEVFGLKAAAVAAYPMYKGVAKLVGMEVLGTGESLDDEIATLKKHWNDYDFFYFHVKKIDSAGEDGNYDLKVKLIEELDEKLPEILKLNPDVVVVTGDHSTPAYISNHGWHPVPTLVWSKYCRRDRVAEFGERACMNGGLGPMFPATNIMPIALANGLRIDKFGA